MGLKCHKAAIYREGRGCAMLIALISLRVYAYTCSSASFAVMDKDVRDAVGIPLVVPTN